MSNNFVEIQMGGGAFKLGNPEGRGGSSSFGNSGGRGGGQNTVPSVIGVWIFSGMTQCHWGDVKQERWMVPIDSIPLCFTVSCQAD